MQTWTNPTAGSTMQTWTNPTTRPTMQTWTNPTTGPTMQTWTNPTAGSTMQTWTNPTTGSTMQTWTNPTTGPTMQTWTNPTAGSTMQTWTNPTTGPTMQTWTNPTTGPTMQTWTNPTPGSTIQTTTETTIETTIETTTVSVQTPFIKLTIKTKSGEEDSSFTLIDSTDILTVQQRLSNLSPTLPPDWPYLGFRGYALESQGISSFPLYARVFQGVIQIFDNLNSNFYQDNHGLESFLSQKASSTGLQPTENDTLVTPDDEVPTTTPKADDKEPPKTLPTSGSEPPYEPEKWNKEPEIDNNNCYAYATNIQGKSFPRPGRAGGKSPPMPGKPGYDCPAFIAAAEADGLVKVDCDKACPKDSFKVALVMRLKPADDQDYHWYRQDKDGKWSHKRGDSPAKNVDEKKNPITDPRDADREGYTTFCGCFCVHPKKVNIRDLSLQMYVF